MAPENRCSPYDRAADYPYPQSVEQDIVRGLGAIYGPYTGTCFGSPCETDIEHIVATSEAHDSGLCAADRETRTRYAQDLRNLTLASPQMNRFAKSGKDAAEWSPDRNRCWFAGRVVEIKRAYGLTVDPREAATRKQILRECASTAMERKVCRSRAKHRAELVATQVTATMRSRATTTTATAGSRARRRAGTGLRPFTVPIPRTPTCGTEMETESSASSRGNGIGPAASSN